MTDKTENDPEKPEQDDFDEHFDESFEDNFDDSFEFDSEESAASETESTEPVETSESAESTEFEQAEPAPKPTATVQKNTSSLPIIIGIAILGFLGWKLYDTLLPKEKTHAKKPAAAAPTSATLPTAVTAPTVAEPTAVTTPAVEEPAAVTLPTAAEPNAITQPNAVTEPAATTTPISSPSPFDNLAIEKETEMQKQLTADITELKQKLEEQNIYYKRRLDLLQTEITSSKNQSATTLRNIQDDIKTLSNAIRQINFLQQEKERQAVREQLTQSKPKPKPAAPSPASPTLSQTESAPSLTVYAIIPGRAWLRNTNGQTITVAEGDMLPEYGKVLKIDPNMGVVITTSGVTLR